MWARFEMCGKRFKLSWLTLSTFFPMQISNRHCPSEPDGWAECAALPTSPTLEHTHTLMLGGVGVGGGGGGGVVAQSLWFFLSSISPAGQRGCIIYNHFSSGSSDRCDSWPPNSSNLIICHSWDMLNRRRTHPPLNLPVPQWGQYGKQIFHNRQQRNGFRFNTAPVCQSDTFPQCECFCCNLYYPNRFTVDVNMLEMMYYYTLSHKSFLFVSEL